MRSVQLAGMSTVAAVARFQPDSLMKEADRLTGETRGLALQQPDPNENLSWPVVQQAAALALLSLLISAKAIAFSEVMAQGLVTAMALLLAMALVLAMVLASQLEFGLELVSGSALQPEFAQQTAWPLELGAALEIEREMAMGWEWVKVVARPAFLQLVVSRPVSAIPASVPASEHDLHLIPVPTNHPLSLH